MLVIQINFVVLVVLVTFVLAIANYNSIYSEFCRATASQNYLCPATEFHFYPSSKFDCLLNLATYSQVTSTCKFRKNLNKTVAVHHSPPFNYFFFKTKLKLTLTCGGKSTLKHLQGNFAIPEHCGVSAPGVITIFPSVSKTADANPNLPSVASVVLRSITFAEEAKQIVVESLQKEEPIQVPDDDDDLLWAALHNAQPYMSYVGSPLLILISMIALIGVGRCLYQKKLRTVVQKVRYIANNCKTDVPDAVEIPEARNQAP